jgi:hypothetical protein
MGKEVPSGANQDQSAKLAFKKAQILARRQKKKLFHSTNPLLVSKKERQVQKVIAKKNLSKSAPTPGGDKDLLMRDTSSKMQKIRKQTLFLVQVDKYAVRDAIEALRGFHEDMAELKDHTGRRDDLVELVITISKVLAKVTLKPIKVPVVHAIHTPEQKGLSCMLHRDNNKKIEGMKGFFSANRVQVGLYNDADIFFKEVL